jgi:two-component system sensor histidine kinase KdpD
VNPATNKSMAAREQEIARLRGDLLTVASRFSHDLRTPLGGMVSSAEAIKEILAHHDPTAVGLADSLINSAEEMNQLIRQLSFVTRASANPLPKIPVHMAEPVFAALQRLESRILKQQASVTEPATWPVVPGVGEWLAMIWWHFVMNALRHAGNKCRIELGWTQQKTSIQFWVRDSGPGVPAALHAKLFTQFHLLHVEKSAPGLGLSIVQRLVGLQGGDCAYESPPQGGALFSFTLPSGAPPDSPPG